MLRFLSQDLTIAKRSIAGREEGSYLGHLLLMKPLGFFRGLTSWPWAWQKKVHVLSKDDLSIFCNVGLWYAILFKVDEHSSLWNETRNLAFIHCESILTSAWIGNSLEGLGVGLWLHSVSRSRGSMSNTSLWALAINLWNGARTGEENWETALDFLTSCWIKKQWEALPFLTEASSLPMKFPASVSMVGTVPL